MIPVIYFIHDLHSLPTSSRGTRLDEATGITSVKLGYGPAKTWETNIGSLFQQAAHAATSAIFVGEGMGGFYAAQLAAYFRARCYLLNPVTVPAWHLQQYVGRLAIEGGASVTITEKTIQSYNAAPDPRTTGTLGRIGLMLSRDDAVIPPEDTEVYYADWSLFTDWVDDGHTLGLDSSFRTIGDRIKAWTMALAFPLIGGVSGATSENTPGSIMVRDANGNASVADPVKDGHIATKSYVDRAASEVNTAVSGVSDGLAAHEGATAPHGATAAATANRLVLRDASGRVRAASPSAAADIANKDYVDKTVAASAKVTELSDARDGARKAATGVAASEYAVGAVNASVSEANAAVSGVSASVAAHEKATTAHGATAAATANAIILRDASGRARVASPSAAADIATKEYVDGVAGGVANGNTATATKLATARSIGISGGATGTATSFDGTANITIPVTALDVSKANAGTLAVARGGTGQTTVQALRNSMGLGNTTGVLPVANGGTGNTTGNAATAAKWATARTITLTGAVTGAVSVDGSGNATLATTASSSLAVGKASQAEVDGGAVLNKYVAPAELNQWYRAMTEGRPVWRQSVLPVSAAWTSISIDGARGLAVGSSGAAAYSTNGGVSWQATTLPSGAAHVSIDGLRAVAIGDYNTNIAAYSTDGGVTWKAATLPVNGSWRSVSISGSRVVAANTSGSSQGAAYSTNGGATWTIATSAVHPLLSVSISGARVVGVTGHGTSGMVYYSTNGGQTWGVATISLSSLTGAAISGARAVVVGYGNTAAYSTNGGQTWQTATMPSSADWRSVSIDGLRAIAVANGTAAAYSTDGGVTWKASALPVSCSYPCVSNSVMRAVAVPNSIGTVALYSAFEV